MPPSPPFVSGSPIEEATITPETSSTNDERIILPNTDKQAPKKYSNDQTSVSESSQSSSSMNERKTSIHLPAKNEPKGSRFVLFIIRQYRKWAYFISVYDWHAILICCLISLLAQAKLAFTPQQDDIFGYSPYGARARTELQRYEEFFGNTGMDMAIGIFALAKDGGTMLRSEHLKEVIDILDFTSSNFTIKKYNDSKSFNDFCVSFCQINEPIRKFYQGFEIQTKLAESNQPLTPKMHLRYPISKIFGREFSLQNNFFGIDLVNDTIGISQNATKAAVSENRSKKHVTNMDYVKMVVFTLRAEHQIGWDDNDVKKYEMSVVEFFKKKYQSKNLNIYTLSRTYVEEEVKRAGTSLIPYVAVGFMIMLFCSVIGVVIRAYYLKQHSANKILLALASCILPLLACGTALALMTTIGFRYSSILCVIPLLVLAIGIDSSYLMIHEWQRIVQQCRENPTDENGKIEYRIAEVLSEVGPAIMISALTNMLADAVGAFTSSPEITLLCVGNLLSMGVVFIYQMTFYVGLMSLIGKKEIKMEEEKRKNLKEKEIAENGAEKEIEFVKHHSKPAKQGTEEISKTMWTYVSLIANKFVASFIIFLYIVYVLFSVYGITQINIHLSTQKLFPQDSPLLELDKLRVKYQVPHFTMATVFINNPGNFSDHKRLERMNQFVGDMESQPGGWGPVSTKYFVRDFLAFENTDFENIVEDEDTESSFIKDNTTLPSPTQILKDTNALVPLYNDEDLSSFISWPEYSFWSGFIRLKNESLLKANDSKLEKFFFTTAYHGKELSKYIKLGNALNGWRSVVDKYATEFDASIFHEEAVFLDLINNIPIDTMQAVCGAVICIGFVCYIFLNSWFAVTIATVSVLSICTGILGLISWWNVDLDPISMAAMIICVGSSCDLPAHTSFHYYLATVREGPKSDPKVKLANCLSTIAFPAVQAGISMILCVCALLFVNIYMSIVFVKMMFLCVVLCNLHALVIIPAFLVMFDYIRFGFNSKKIHHNGIVAVPELNNIKTEDSTKNMTNIPI